MRLSISQRMRYLYPHTFLELHHTHIWKEGAYYPEICTPTVQFHCSIIFCFVFLRSPGYPVPPTGLQTATSITPRPGPRASSAPPCQASHFGGHQGDPLLAVPSKVLGGHQSPASETEIQRDHLRAPWRQGPLRVQLARSNNPPSLPLWGRASWLHVRRHLRASLMHVQSHPDPSTKIPETS